MKNVAEYVFQTEDNSKNAIQKAVKNKTLQEIRKRLKKIELKMIQLLLFLPAENIKKW